MEVRLENLEGVIDALRKLPAEVVSRRGGPVRSALRKGAVVIHKQELANLRLVIARASSASEADRDKRTSTGLLAENLVITRGKPPSDGKGERFLVRVRRKVYPRKGKSTTTLASAQLLEWGSSQQPAEPWIRPAFEGRAREAIQVVSDELLAAIERIGKRLLKQKGT